MPIYYFNKINNLKLIWIYYVHHLDTLKKDCSVTEQSFDIKSSLKKQRGE